MLIYIEPENNRVDQARYFLMVFFYGLDVPLFSDLGINTLCLHLAFTCVDRMVL